MTSGTLYILMQPPSHWRSIFPPQPRTFSECCRCFFTVADFTTFCWWRRCCCCTRILVTTWVVSVGKIVASVTGVDQPKTHATSIRSWTLGRPKELSTDFDSTFLLPFAMFANQTHLLFISICPVAAI